MPRPDVSDQRIPQILDAATKLFSEHGVHAASMSQIAKEADLSKATIYHYFESKEALVEALVAQVFETEQPEFQQLITGDSPAAERISSYAAQLANLLGSNPLMYSIIAELYLQASRLPSVQHIIQNYFERYVEGFEQIVQQGIERGELRAELNAHETSVAITSLIEGCILVGRNLAQPIDEIMSKSVAVFLQGLRP